MSMQMDAYLKRSRLVPFLSGWGHRKGGLGGWVGQGDPAQKSYVPQEAARSITFETSLSILLKIIYSESCNQELSIGIYMGPIGAGGGWWVVGGGPDFLGPPLQIFSETFSRDFKHISGFLGSSPVHCHPLWVK
jgi:hypothetical protein